MNIWLPGPIYHLFPLLSVLTGFGMVALVPNPVGVIVASGLYIYAFRVLWLRTPVDHNDKS